MRHVVSLTAAVLMAVGILVPAHAEKRVALVIGNSTYSRVPSHANSANDARLMADTLRGLGFALIGDDAQLDLDKAGIDGVVQSFGKQLQGATWGCSIMPATACRCAAPTIWCRSRPIRPGMPTSTSR